MRRRTEGMSYISRQGKTARKSRSRPLARHIRTSIYLLQIQTLVIGYPCYQRVEGRIVVRRRGSHAF